MDLNELKLLLKHSASVVLLENGHPSLVIVDYHVYKNLLPSEPGVVHGAVGETQSVSAQQQFSPEEQEAIERLNREILALKEQIAMEESGAE